MPSRILFQRHFILGRHDTVGTIISNLYMGKLRHGGELIGSGPCRKFVAKPGLELYCLESHTNDATAGPASLSIYSSLERPPYHRHIVDQKHTMESGSARGS